MWCTYDANAMSFKAHKHEVLHHLNVLASARSRLIMDRHRGDPMTNHSVASSQLGSL